MIWVVAPGRPQGEGRDYPDSEPALIPGGIFVRATLGTMGFVWARTSTPETWSTFARAYPVQAPGEICTGSSGQSGLARPGPAQIL